MGQARGPVGTATRTLAGSALGRPFLVSLGLHGALLGGAGVLLLGGEGAPPRAAGLETGFETALALARDPPPPLPGAPEVPVPADPTVPLREAVDPPPDPRLAAPEGVPVAVLPEVAVTFEGAARALPREPAAAQFPDSGADPRVQDAVPPAPPAGKGGFAPARPLRDLCPAPGYPRRERERGIEGSLRVRLRVAADGSVAGVEVTESSGSAGLDRSAVEALATWRFRPAEEDGVPVPSVVTLPVRFTLD